MKYMADGGIVGADGMTEAQRAKRNAALSSLGMSTAPAPVQPAQAAPLPQAPVQQPPVQAQDRPRGIIGIVGGRQQQIDKAAGYACGGKIKAHAQGGKISGPGTPTSDSIDAGVRETGEQIKVSTDERILSKAQDAVVAMFASRRFPMPAAASLSAVMQIEEKAMDSMAAASRQIAVMSVEQYRFVITQVMAARGMVLNAANAFVLAVASAPDAAGKLLGVGYDVQTKLIDAAASFYSADAQAKKIIAEVGEFNVSSTLDASKTTANLALEASKSTVGFALEADKAEAGFSLEAGKATAGFALDARKLNVNLGFEASKMNASSAMDADKANAQLALEAAKSFEGFVLDARKAYLALVSEVGRENARLSLEASKTNAETTLRASTHNATLLHETSKLNVGYALEAEKANLGAVISITDFNSRAILEELRLITSQAVAALNNLHIGISMSAGGTNITSAAGEYA